MNTGASATIHIVDDDASFRKSTARLLTACGYEVAVYESAIRFLETADLGAHGCVLLDVRMPGLTGFQLQERLTEMRRALPVIFLTGHGDIPTSVRAVKAGAEDFLTKPVAMPALLETIERALARDRQSRAQAGHLEALRARYDALTPKEADVFALIVRGKLNKEVAYDLGSSERTVKWHRHNLMEKLGVQSLAGLVSFAERLGLLTEPGSGPIKPG